jgi:methionyl-tRNA formyltransferase
MSWSRVDLFLGGPLGLWTLGVVKPEQVGTVYSAEVEICRRAVKLGRPFVLGALTPTPLPGGEGRVGMSVHYPFLLSEEVLSAYKVIYNLHPALLPWGRCYYPVFWALWAGEPAGCTLHEIAPGIDDGDIVDQREVEVFPWDTGGTLHARVSAEEKRLFAEWWPEIASGRRLPSVPQDRANSFHYRSEFMALKRGKGIEEMTGPEVLKLVRCLSHPDYTGLEVEMGGRRYEISARRVDG